MLQLWTHNKENLFIMNGMDLCVFFFDKSDLQYFDDQEMEFVFGPER